MAYELTELRALARADFDTIIDVRSPSEFAEDHLPGAINLPVLSDEERAKVGTIYVQDSPFKARKLGAALVSKNAARHLEGPLAGFEGGWKPLVYCWRGGQRSGAFATILSQIGWRVDTLLGGYQSYRRLVANSLYETEFPAPIVLLDGNTGTAKTELIKRLPALGVQTIDLEGIARHRGSALGGQGDQPSQKAFESALALAASSLDPERPVLVEAESSRIGRLNLPPKLLAAMKAAPRIEICADVAVRARYLCQAYSDLIADPHLLADRLGHLVRLQGRAQVDEWIALSASGDHLALAQDLIRKHYDPRYNKVRTVRAANTLSVDADTLDDAGIDDLAARITSMISEI